MIVIIGQVPQLIYGRQLVVLSRQLGTPIGYKVFSVLSTSEDWDPPLVARVKCNKTIVVHLPTGYYCNGFSIPRCLRWLAGSPWQKGWQAAVWHDFMREAVDNPTIELYGGATWSRAVHGMSWTRREADAIFAELLRYYDVPAWKRFIFSSIVRVF